MGMVLLILLLMIVFGGLPNLGFHSYGYGPSGIGGVLLVVVAGFAGVVTADWILYGIGRYYGAALVDHPRLGRLLGVHRIDAVRGAVMRHQARAVFFARFVLGTRILTFVAAGTFGVSAVRFALAEAAGSAIFVSAMATLGYLFTDRALRIVHGAGRVEHWLVLGGLIGLALYLLALHARAARTPLDDGDPRPR